LQQAYPKFKKLDAEVLAVFREERDGAAGLAKVRSKTKAAFPLLLDLNKVATGEYSDSGFHTYLINKQGKIEMVLTGKITNRPSGEEIFKAAQEVFAKGG